MPSAPANDDSPNEYRDRPMADQLRFIRQLVRTLGQHQGPVHTTCLSWDGALGLSAGGLEDGAGEVYIWNIETGEQIMGLSGHQGPVRAVAR